MKRFLSISVCILSLALLTACGVRTAAPADGEFEDVWDEAWDEAWEEVWEEVQPAMEGLDGEAGKAHYYQVLNGEEEELYTITDETQVAALDGLLSDVGERLERPVSEDGGEIACIYVYQQEKTRLAGEDPGGEREYGEVIRFTVYQDRDLITLQCLKGLEDRDLAGIRLEDFLTFTFSVSAEAMEALRDPAQFAE